MPREGEGTALGRKGGGGGAAPSERPYVRPGRPLAGLDARGSAERPSGSNATVVAAVAVGVGVGVQEMCGR